MNLDLKLAELIKARLDEVEAESTKALVTALPYEKYQQSCGYLECLRQIRDNLLPSLVKDIVKEIERT